MNLQEAWEPGGQVLPNIFYPQEFINIHAAQIAAIAVCITFAFPNWNCFLHIGGWLSSGNDQTSQLSRCHRETQGF